MTRSDEYWMTQALLSAEEALRLDEVPVGACLVASDGNLLASAFNKTISDCDPTAHAEILALRQAAIQLSNYRLLGSTVYSTVEPCVMCAGALVNARVSRLVFGTRDERFGGVVSRFRLCDSELLNHRIEIVEGVLSAECRKLMQDFFESRR